jgi:hypothetical protein
MRLTHSDTLHRSRWRAAGIFLLLALLACSHQGAHEATLRWNPVTQLNDGTPFTDLAGYRIYYGPSVDNMQVVVLPDPHATSYVFKNLTPGLWYFSVAAYTRSGTQGLSANLNEKTIQ